MVLNLQTFQLEVLLSVLNAGSDFRMKRFVIEFITFLLVFLHYKWEYHLQEQYRLNKTLTHNQGVSIRALLRTLENIS